MLVHCRLPQRTSGYRRNIDCKFHPSSLKHRAVGSAIRLPTSEHFAAQFKSSTLRNGLPYILDKQAHSLYSKQFSRRRIDRLTHLLNKLRWPCVKTFWAFGQEYQLPVNASLGRQNVKALSKSRLDYFAGFFDGDGCVFGHKRTGCGLSIGQNIDSGEALLLLQRSFGGTIAKQSDGKGLCKPMLRWSVYGQLCKEAAALMAPAAIVKAEQLRIAAAWPACKHRRADAYHLLSVLKGQDCHASIKCSWGYVAGFFDAEGCVSVSPKSANIILKISQKHCAILVWLQNFIMDDLPGMTAKVSVAPAGKSAFSLQIQHSEAARIVLRRMLAAGLLIKRRRAEIVLELDHRNHTLIRQTLLGTAGHQSRYLRLDLDGCERARAIARARGKLQRVLSTGAHDAIHRAREHLAELLGHHALKRAEFHHLRLRSDIRHLLSRGACVDAASSKMLCAPNR
eukprot:TRINITY_DN47589_c0_g1_i1.p1 TRINITY_DN47589_c0_g1~~TRINITY_DN47589_c0_g1_i1.p1  ORF type:complete len:453 (+),score=48.26 TRINITY_DN47589_c0_g1_i1:123-1481(+)